MTSAQQSFTTDDMNALTATFSTGRDNFTDSQGKIRNHVGNIQSIWQGQAPTAFGEAMRVFDSKMQKMIADCTDIIGKLQKAGATYDTQVADMSQAGGTLSAAMEGN